MKFKDLQRQHRAIEKEVLARMAEVMRESAFIGGDRIRRLEERLAAYAGRRHCITCGNGTDAIWLTLKAWGIGPGDAVFIPSFTFAATAEGAALLGATPVFVDVCPETYNMSAPDLEAKIRMAVRCGLNPKVVIAVDLFGLCCDYFEIRGAAEKYGIKILGDAAQSFGSGIGVRRACGFGDASITSFFPAKPLGCYGDGGAVFTDDDRLCNLIRSIAEHGGGGGKYENVRLGVNSRLDALQAAVLDVKLDVFEGELEAVNILAERYLNKLPPQIKRPALRDGYRTNWAQFTVRFSDNGTRERARQFLSERGIPAMVYYPKPLHMQNAFKDICISGKNPVSEELSKTVLSLPIYPYMSGAEVDIVTGALKDFFKKQEQMECSLVKQMKAR
jgi:UDP-2-acetamido-2-deoxy-ribo-hexuluronate aminotransferase